MHTMDANAVEEIVTHGLPGSACQVTDLTGTLDHWGLEITWSGFEGLSLLQQHRKVLDIMRPYMEDGDNSIHAVQIRTLC